MPPGFDGGHDLLVGVRLQVLERQVLQLVAHLPHSQAMGDGRVDLGGLAGDALLALRAEEAESAHVMETVRQLDQNDADVLHHGQEHLADALGLALLGGEEIELGELGHAIHAARHLFAELFANLLDGHAGILHHVVQQTGLDGDRIHAHVGEDESDGGRVDHVRLAGIARLPLVPLAGEAECPVESRQIVLGTVVAHPGFQLATQPLNRVVGCAREGRETAG